MNSELRHANGRLRFDHQIWSGNVVNIRSMRVDILSKWHLYDVHMSSLQAFDGTLEIPKQVCRGQSASKGNFLSSDQAYWMLSLRHFGSFCDVKVSNKCSWFPTCVCH